MKTLILLFGCGAAALLLSLILTPLARGLMRRLGAVDKPSARRINRVPIPRGGGLAVVITVPVVAAAAALLFPEAVALQGFWGTYALFIAATAVMLVIGLWDDLKGLSPLTKLGAQVAVALLFCLCGVRFILPESIFGALGTSPWVYVPMTVAWYVGVINACNLIDGLDGLASGLAIIATLGLIGVVLLTGGDRSVVYYGAILIGALLGFLRYNYNPASVFLGDTGSLFVGLSLATFSLLSSRQETLIVTMGAPLLCLGVPLADTVLAIVRRTLRRVLRKAESAALPAVAEGQESAESEAIMTADRDHLHHRMLALVHGNQRHAVGILYALAVGLVALGFGLTLISDGKTTLFLIGFIVFAYIITQAMTNVELWDAGRLLSRPETRIGRRGFVIPCYLTADAVCMAGLFGFLAYVTEALDGIPPLVWLNLFVAFAVPVFVAVACVKGYTRVWGRSTRKDTFQLGLAVLLGALIAHLILTVAIPEAWKDVAFFHMIWAGMLPLPLLAARLVKPALVQYIATLEAAQLRRRSLHDASIPRVLFYGAGINLRAYITLFETNVTRNRVALIGILDDKRSLRGRIFRDLPILGPLEILEDTATFAELRPTQIVMTTPTIGPEREADIRAFCARHGLKLSRFAMTETEVRC